MGKDSDEHFRFTKQRGKQKGGKLEGRLMKNKSNEEVL